MLHAQSPTRMSRVRDSGAPRLNWNVLLFKAQALGKAAERLKSPRLQMTPRKYFLDTTGWMHTQTQKDWDRKDNTAQVQTTQDLSTGKGGVDTKSPPHL